MRDARIRSPELVPDSQGFPFSTTAITGDGEGLGWERDHNVAAGAGVLPAPPTSAVMHVRARWQ